MRAALFAGLCLAASLAQADRRIAIDADQRIDSAASDALEVADAFADALAAGELDTVKSLLAEDAIASTETLVLEKRKTGWKIVHIHWSSR